MSTLLLHTSEQEKLTLVDAKTLEIIQKFDVPGRTAVLGASPHQRFGFAIHRDHDAITIIDGVAGIHLGTITVENQPTHFHAYDGHILIFNDGSGSVSLFWEEDLCAGKVAPQQLKVGPPDHGSAVLVENILLAGFLRSGRVIAYQLDNMEKLLEFNGCTALHGAAQIDNIAIFGCKDGVLLIQKESDTLVSVQIANPSNTSSQNRVGIIATHPKSKIAVGNWGTGLALIFPQEKTMKIINLPAHPLKFSFDDAGDFVLVLGHDGYLYELDLEGNIIRRSQLLDAVIPPKGRD
ncbi:MAG: hypothetical protein CUN55_11275, partial [Phototrophicales bacterium]